MATPNAANAAALTAAGEATPRPDQPQRPDPVGVGAADAVGVVVRVVHARPAGPAPPPARAAPSTTPPRRRTPRRRCRPARGRRPRGGCAGARLRATAQGLPQSGILAGIAWSLVSSPPSGLDPCAAPPARSSGCSASGTPPTTRRRWSSRPPGRPEPPKRVRALPGRDAGLGGRHARPARRPRAVAAEPAPGLRRRAAGAVPLGPRRHRAGRPGRSSRRGAAMTGARRYVSLVPTQLRPAPRRPPRRRCAASTPCWSAAPASTRRCARAPRAAGVRVVATYGMSETCGGCVYDGVPLDGVEVGSAPTAGCGSADRCSSTGTTDEPDLTAQALARTAGSSPRTSAASTTTACCG